MTESISRFRSDVLAGLGDAPKHLPCKYFYDREGSELYEEICRQPEYYLTEVELAILGEHAQAIADSVGPGKLVVELGTGSGRKTRSLLACLHRPAAYMAVDLARDQLAAATEMLAQAFPALPLRAEIADFTSACSITAEIREQAVLLFFPGSTIGNFETHQTKNLLTHWASLVGSGSQLLIGTDLVKDRELLERAYDDCRGVTAAFNRNLLKRINRELDGAFVLERFRHLAEYDDEAQRIVMYLESLQHQRVAVAGQVFEFQTGERIRTEYSHKYTIAGFAALAATTGWVQQQVFTDSRQWFALQLFTRTAS